MVRLKAECRNNPSRFNRRVLGRPAFWWRQHEIAESVRRYLVTLAPAGNMVGKSFSAAGIVLWFLHNHAAPKVICTAPTQTQLEEVLWADVHKSHTNSRIPLAGKVYRSPLKIDKDGRGVLLAYSTTKTERLSGHHAADLLAVIDEGSGVAPEIWEAIDSLGPSRLLVLGNPLRPDGPFYDRCTRALANPTPLVNVIRVPSLESPDIHLERSHRGLADAGWLAKARNDYGEDSIWWKSHVLAQFPDETTDAVFPLSWLDLARRTVHAPAHPSTRRLAVDLSLGGGGDMTVLIVADANGVLHCEASNKMGLEAAAARAALLCQQFGMAGHQVSWDVEGIGADFLNRLQAAGLRGCHPYRGGAPVPTPKFANRRGLSAWRARQRLDPAHMATLATGALVPQTPYSLTAVPEASWSRMRQDLRELRYSLGPAGQVVLETGKLFRDRLKRSPDHGDVFGQLFGLAV
jgi:hypothetical protein